MLALVDCQMDDRVFFFNDTATTEIYTLSLHDALPISRRAAFGANCPRRGVHADPPHAAEVDQDRKSTRLNSSHLVISYAVFCLKKKMHSRQSLIPSVPELPDS